MAVQISTQCLRKKILFYLTAYMLLASVVIAAIATFPIIGYLKDEVKKTFLNSTIVRAVAIDERLDKMMEIAEQAAKRFGIISYLEAYARGEIDLKTLVDYIEPRHRMSMALSEDITGISQYDGMGNPIVQLGLHIPSECVHAHSATNKTPEVHIHGPNLIDQKPQFLVHIPMFNSDQKLIGSSYLLFSLDQLKNLLTPDDTLDPNSRFFLGTLDLAEGGPKLLLESEPAAAKDRQFADRILERISRDQHEEKRGQIQDNGSRSRPNVATFVKLQQAQLVLLGKMSKANLYKRVDQFTGVLLTSVIILILLGTAGMYFLSRPLTGRVLVYSNELEELNRQLKEEIHRQQQAEQSLNLALAGAEKSRERVDAIVHSVPDALLVVDHENRIELLNAPAEQLLSTTTASAAGCVLFQLLPEQTFATKLAELLSSSAAPLETDLIWPTASSDKKILRVRISAIHAREEQPPAWILLLQDVTRQRHIEQMKSEFISTAAHELRTPMTIIMGFAELLTSGQDIPDSQQQEYLSYILEKSEDLSKILDDLLDISRIESGRPLVLHLAPQPVGALIEQTVKPYRERFTSHVFETALVNPDQILLLDRGKFSQVLENLLSNAVKYSPAGSLIRIRSELREDHYQIAVSDQGIGMTAEQAAQVFDKFYRVDASNTAAEGTGLGMFIVRHIVHSHRGRIWIDSALGQGTTVYFSLPLADQEHQKSLV